MVVVYVSISIAGLRVTGRSILDKVAHLPEHFGATLERDLGNRQQAQFGCRRTREPVNGVRRYLERQLPAYGLQTGV